MEHPLSVVNIENTADGVIACVVNHDWLTQVYNYFTQDLIDANTLLTAIKWIAENLC